MKIILGSSSATRQEILREMGYDFEVVAVDVDEKKIRTDDYHELPLAIARAKAEALKAIVKEPAILLTADVIAVFDGKVLEKPEDAEDARRTLKGYSDKMAEAVTGVVIVDTKNGQTIEGTDISKVYFKEIPDEVIEKIIKKGNILNCAGSFEIRDPLVRKYIDRVDGTDESVAGLPVEMVRNMLEKIGRKPERKETFPNDERKIR
jgi:septum formation protein